MTDRETRTAEEHLARIGEVYDQIEDIEGVNIGRDFDLDDLELWQETVKISIPVYIEFED